MKILKLRFKNIHSFKGAHEVDFTIPPLSMSGLFAITGSTGAGKSTVLDVITLALFNQIPRFDGKITNAEIETLGSVMTHFTDDAYAEVEYQTGNSAYRSTWKISKTRNNTLRDYEMTLADLHDGMYLDLKKSEVPKRNEQIIGLNYDQFVRSIILSQGEFARFLRADKSERTTLLEEITGSKIYRALGKAAFEKAKSKRDEVQQLKIRKEAIPLLTNEDIASKSITIEKNKELIFSTDLELVAVKNNLTIIERRLQITQKINEVQIEMDALKEKKFVFEIKATQLKKHQNLDLYRNEITLWKHENQLVAEKEKEIADCNMTIAKQGMLLGEAINEMAIFTNVKIDENNFLSEIKKFENLVIRLDGELTLLKEKGTQSRSELNALLENPNYSNHASQISQFKSIHEQLEYCKNSNDKLKTRRIYTENDDQLRKTMRGLIDEISELELRHASAVNYSSCQTEILIFNDKKLELLESKVIVSNKIINLENNLNKLKNELTLLQKSKEDQFKVASLEEQRKLLIDNEPCPLCGSVHHPYAADNLYYDLGKAEAQIMQVQYQTETSQKDHLSLTAQLSSITTEIGAIEKNVENLGIKMAAILKEYPEFAQATVNVDRILQQIKHLKEESNAIQSEIEFRAAFSFYSQCETKLEILIETSEKYRQINQQRQSLYTGHDVNGDAEAIQNKYISARDLSKEWKGKLLNLENNLNLLVVTHTNRENQLVKALIPLGYHDVSAALSDILDDEIIRNIISEKDKLHKEETELDSTMRTLRSDAEEALLPDGAEIDVNILRTKIHTLESQKDQLIHQNGALTNELENNTKAKQSIKEVEELLAKKYKEAEVWYIMEKLIGDATGSKYARYAQNLSLKHLIDLANRRLNKLTDRYQLVYTDIESDLTISDMYQGNIRRSVKTLSGGESFIVSLALALSLADMASQNVKLESLFIDEGFGTLDNETLEVAIETLEKLQTESDRIIGIISHVESLKERITTQIKVVKNVGGYASIELIG